MNVSPEPIDPHTLSCENKWDAHLLYTQVGDMVSAVSREGNLVSVKVVGFGHKSKTAKQMHTVRVGSSIGREGVRTS